MTCNSCQGTYDLECANVSYPRFQLMSPTRRTTWKCDKCWRELHDKIEEAPLTPDCVTKRKHFTVNVSVENTFGSLSEHEDLDLSSSLANRSCSGFNRSCPELESFIRDDLKTMNVKISKLQDKLEIAESEIVSLLSENHELSKQISEYELRVKQLTAICSSSGKITKRKSTKKKNPKKSFSQTLLDLSQNNNLTQEEQNQSYDELNIAEKGTAMDCDNHLTSNTKISTNKLINTENGNGNQEHKVEENNIMMTLDSYPLISHMKYQKPKRNKN